MSDLRSNTILRIWENKGKRIILQVQGKHQNTETKLSIHAHFAVYSPTSRREVDMGRSTNVPFPHHQMEQKVKAFRLYHQGGDEDIFSGGEGGVGTSWMEVIGNIMDL
jgi:hypothetical protein